MVAAGPPCQAFNHVAVAKLKSIGKSTTMRNPLNQLYKEVLRIVDGLMPPFFVIENVGRMFSMSDGVVKKEIERYLDGKYNVSFYYEDVADYGVPQHRKRGIAIGNKIGIVNPKLIPTHYNPKKEIVKGKKPHETVKDTINDLPKIQINSGKEIMEYPKRKIISEYQRRMRGNSKKSVQSHI